MDKKMIIINIIIWSFAVGFGSWQFIFKNRDQERQEVNELKPTSPSSESPTLTYQNKKANPQDNQEAIQDNQKTSQNDEESPQDDEKGLVEKLKKGYAELLQNTLKTRVLIQSNEELNREFGEDWEEIVDKVKNLEEYFNFLK